MRSLFQHTEGRAITFALLVAVLAGLSAAFTSVWRQHPIVCGALLLACGVALRVIALGPRARYLPENAVSAFDFVSRPLNARPWAGRVAVITGSNSGIGFCTVQQVAALGAHVVMVDVQSDEQNDAARARVLQADPQASLVHVRIDLGALDTIAAGAAEIVRAACTLRGITGAKASAVQCIDYLANNAGLADDRGRFVNGHSHTMAVNIYGAYVLTEKLLPHIAINGRIVNIASVAHTWLKVRPTSLNMQARVVRMLEDAEDPDVAALVTQNGGVYAVSKLCCLLHACALAKRADLQKRGIIAVSLHPGAVSTNIWSFLDDRPLLRTALNLVMSVFFKDCMAGSQTTLHCLTAGHIMSGGYYADCHLFRPRDEVNQENVEAVEAWLRNRLAKWL